MYLFFDPWQGPPMGTRIIRGVSAIQVDGGVHNLPIRVSAHMFRSHLDTYRGNTVSTTLLFADKHKATLASQILSAN